MQVDPLAWGLASMVSWGVSDYLARHAALRLGSPVVAMVVQGLGIAPPVVLAISNHDPWAVIAQWDFLLLAVAAGSLFALAYTTYYRGLERGQVFIVSPLSSGWLVITTLLAAMLFHESISLVQGLLITLVLAGIVLTSVQGYGAASASISGVWYGLTAMFTMGLAFTIWKPLVDAGGPYVAVVAVRVVSTVFLGLFLASRKAQLPPMGAGVAVFAAGAAALDSVGFVAFNMGIERAPVSLITPVAASYPVVTLLLAWFLLKERVGLIQMAGIAAVLGGVAAYGAFA